VAASLLFGILYARTLNLWLVICLHAAYDALWSLTPIGTRQFFPYSFGLLVLMASLCLAVIWGSLPNRNRKLPRDLSNPR
jgi:membrane protease YdiL (CAAX protease family)